MNVLSLTVNLIHQHCHFKSMRYSSILNNSELENYSELGKRLYIHSSKFNVQYGTVVLSLIFLLSKL